MIRAFRPADRDEWLHMRQALWPDSTEADAQSALDLPGSRFVILVAEDAHRLVAFAEIATREFAEGCTTSPVAYLEGLWVSPDARRAGLGLQLVRAAFDWARAHGYTEMASDCAIDNVPSEAWHAAAGFQQVGRVICFRLDLAGDDR